eukprot:1302349-Pleurochrysis_carterae.AAC.2
MEMCSRCCATEHGTTRRRIRGRMDRRPSEEVGLGTEADVGPGRHLLQDRKKEQPICVAGVFDSIRGVAGISTRAARTADESGNDSTCMRPSAVSGSCITRRADARCAMEPSTCASQRRIECECRKCLMNTQAAVAWEARERAEACNAPQSGAS